jgi:hypothetical protein
MSPTRVKYDGLPAGTHTFLPEETDLECPKHGAVTFDVRDSVCLDGKRLGQTCGKNGKATGKYRTNREVDVFPGDVVEVIDLNHPHSDRARMVRDHVARGLAHELTEEKQPKAKS